MLLCRPLGKHLLSRHFGAISVSASFRRYMDKTPMCPTGLLWDAPQDVLTWWGLFLVLGSLESFCWVLRGRGSEDVLWGSCSRVRRAWHHRRNSHCQLSSAFMPAFREAPDDALSHFVLLRLKAELVRHILLLSALHVRRKRDFGRWQILSKFTQLGDSKHRLVKATMADVQFSILLKATWSIFNGSLWPGHLITTSWEDYVTSLIPCYLDVWPSYFGN